MRLGPIILKIRLGNTRFGNRIAGSAELDLATKYTLTQEMGFVVPLNEDCKENEYENGIDQRIKEQFGVIVAIRNDSYQQDKLGLTAYDQIHDVRSEIWSCILGWEVSWAESVIYYRGGALLLISPAYLWYMFRFEFLSHVLSQTGGISSSIIGAELTTREIIGISTVAEADPNNPVSPMHVSRRTSGVNSRGLLDISQLPSFDKLYVDYLLANDVKLYDGSITNLPLDDGFPDVQLPDQAQWIDLTINPNQGQFWRSFANAFDIYKYT